ncbi:hypothetical protein CSW64_05490 [Caulobacter mirabilis]|uniref:Tetratricopeptide repeat protein n=2 Tax=Caulobacter mirabilis TaxID=69666 RepID=A0A2D2AV98_9CAUL|nr:hypothetical protein CSW64_05490 [Caulobacter mirabilis]
MRLRKEAGAAAQAGDLATAEARLEAALALYPTLPGALVRLARVEVAAGKPQEALAHLEAYARLGLTLDVAGDPALRTLVDLPGFTPVATQLAANRQPAGQLHPIATLADPAFLAEGVAVLSDPVGEDYLVSAVAARTIVRIDDDGAARPFLKGDADTGGLFGMAVDGSASALWIAEAWGEGLPGGVGAKRTGLLKVSTRDGSILGRFPLPDDGRPHQLGDVAVGDIAIGGRVADGAPIYASDAAGGGLWRLAPGAKTPELFVSSREIASPQGMAVCHGRDALVVADYSTGLHRIDTKTGAVTPLTKADAALAGIDGLAWDSNQDVRKVGSGPARPWELIATQNGASPQRILSIRLSPDCRSIEQVRVLAANLPGMDDLALGAVGEAAYIFVGNSQWAGWTADGKRREGVARPAAIFKLALP